MGQGLDIKTIAEELHLTKQLVRQAVQRIHKNQIKQREDQVRAFRAQGYGDKKISEMTGINPGTTTSILARLNRKGETTRLRKKARTKEEMKQFEDQLIALRADPRNLTIKQIAEITGDNRFTVPSRIGKLIRAGRIAKKR